MKIVIASDSFKGSLSSQDICLLFKKELLNHATINHICLSIADGGEGSLEAISSRVKGDYITLVSKNPYFKEIKTLYYLDENKTAYLETAQSAGLNLINKLNPLETSTYGLGEQMLDAILRGAKKIYLFLGGSATNDGGCGLFSALGTKFYNQENEVFIPTGGTLKDITRIDNTHTLNLLKDVEIIGMCDVTNPMYGELGAAYIYGPQKGASKEDVLILDQGLKHLDKIIKKDLNKEVANLKGSGAAGALGAGILAFANGTLKEGVEEILNILNFDEIIIDANYIVSGEGKLDQQSFYGKVISGIANRSLKQNKELILIVGNSEISLKDARNHYSNITNIIETNDQNLPFNEIKHCAKEMYQLAIQKLIKDL